MIAELQQAAGAGAGVESEAAALGLMGEVVGFLDEEVVAAVAAEVTGPDERVAHVPTTAEVVR
ncbi:hypothetical protein ACF058_27565 [Streptomyces sp. NPDC015501]|uniref:hypothetical protein n=1 Tax=unclassified Streptomyces TaxID=2593676 RepID=UPI0011A190FC|nr:hypothetical protein A3L22_28900 [Streptomyces griseus subsp. griseus]